MKSKRLNPYDDYGRLDFDPDQKFLDLIDEDDKNVPSMFILESVFNELDCFSTDKFGDGINGGSAYENSDQNAYNLKLLGFTELKKKSSDKRYDRIFVHASDDTKQIYSDGTWIRIHPGKGEKIIDNIYNWKDFIKHFPDVDYTILHNTSTELNRLESEYYTLEKDSVTALIKKLKLVIPETFDPKILGYETERFCEWNHITPNMFEYMEDEDFRKKVAKIARVYWFMYANNLKFGHRFHGGPQDGNFQALKKLRDLMDLALNGEAEKQKKFKEEWGDDEEDDG